MPNHPPPHTRQVSTWTRFVLPSVADLLFVALLVSLSCGVASLRLLNDGGTGWHILNGRQILVAHAAPHVDSFSAAMSGQPWFAWEWLYDAGIGAVYNASGLNGVVFATAFTIALSFFLVFRWLRKRLSDVPVSILFVILSILASSIHFLARPHVLSWLLTVIYFTILDAHARSRDSRLAMRSWLWLPPLMLLWTNLHGGFVLGFLLLGIYTLSALVVSIRSHDPVTKAVARARSLELAFTGLACALASLINPYGYKLHVHIYGYLTNRFFMDHIEEFQSPNFHNVAGKSFVLLLLVSAFSLAGRRWLNLHQALLAAFAACAGLYASRNLPIASILLVLIAAPLLSQWARARTGSGEDAPNKLTGRLRSFSQRMNALDARLTAHAWPVLVLCIGLWLCGHQGRLGGRQLMDAHFDSARFPVEAAGVLAERKIQEPVFSTDAWGGYLIYRLYPQLKVLVDDRHDLYGEAFLKNYLQVIHAEPGWDVRLDAWNVHWVLMPPASALASVLKERPRWHVEYDDGHAVLFHRE